MPDIRYVILSDLHFGAESSVLTALQPTGVVPDPHTPSTVMTALVDCLSDLVGKNEDKPKPTLILCGDILELALATDNVAAMVFERFVEQIFPTNGGLFDETIYFVPGNHDHHLWEAARERQYAAYLRQEGNGPGADLKIPWHTTRMLTGRDDPEAVEAELLTTLINRYPHLTNVKVLAVYPNLRLTHGDRSVVVHHGHFVESMYRLMSTLKDLVFPGRPPADKIWQWEAENFAWIDFFWSTLGRSGEVGTDVGLLYASLQDKKAMRGLAEALAGSITGRLKAPPPLRWLEGKALEVALVKAVERIGSLERSQPGIKLTPESYKGLGLYLEGPLLEQLYDELDPKREHGTEKLPGDLTFVFGHTHKPFEGRLADLEGYRGPVSIYNTGGWVVDSEKSAPLQGGAAILIDEELSVASLRTYNQESYRVRLAQVDDTATTPFYDRLNSLIQPDEPPWRGLAEATREVVDQRHVDQGELIRRGPMSFPEPDR